MSVNKVGHLMVYETSNHRVLVFELSGKILTKSGSKGNSNNSHNASCPYFKNWLIACLVKVWMCTFKFYQSWDCINFETEEHKKPMLYSFLTLYTLASVCIFSTLFFIHFLRHWQGEFVCWSKDSFHGDHSLYSHDLNVWLRADIVGRNKKLVNLRV